MRAIIDHVLEVFREPAIFLSIIVGIGSFMLSRRIKHALCSSIKTFVGIRIIQVGTLLAIESSKPILEMLVYKFGLSGRVADPWVAVGEGLAVMDQAGLGGLVGIVMISAWLLHLLLARVTKLRCIYLTGHVAFVDTVLVMSSVFMITNWPSYLLILISAIILAIYWWFFPVIFAPKLKDLVGDEKITIGHQVVVSGWLVILLAKLTGKSSVGTEEIKFPEWLSFLNDTIVSYSLIMAIVYLIISLIAGPSISSTISGESNHVFYFALKGVDTGVAITIISLGVKMLLGELMPAFEGISSQLLPGAVAAVDVPIFWKFAPNAALIGFIFTFAGMVVGIFTQIISGSELITIPSIIPLFFGGSTLGVIASKYGGLRGTIFATFLLGIVQVWGSIVFSLVTGFEIAGGGNLDYCTYYPLLFGLLKTLLK